MTKPVSRPAKRPRRPGTPAAAPAQRQSGKAAKTGKTPRHFAIIGAGMAGVVCARTLVQAGHQVTVFEKSSKAGGRTTTIDSPFGSFDAGAQYFTVRDPRFAQAIDTVPGVCRPWSANAVRVLDAAGRVAAAGLPTREPHWVASPGMNALVTTWAAPLLQAGQLITDTRVSSIERDPLNGTHWQVRTEGQGGAQHVYAGFDAVLLAQPATPAQALLAVSGLDTPLNAALSRVTRAPGPDHPWPPVERGTQHPPPHFVAGTRVVQTRPHHRRTLDGASQPGLVGRTP